VKKLFKTIKYIISINPKLHRFLHERKLQKSLPIDFLRSLNELDDSSVCIDLGANIGDISAIIASRGAKVYAFEPNSSAFLQLKKKSKAFPNIKPLNVAAGVTYKTSKLYLHSNNQGKNTIELSSSSSLIKSKPNNSDYNFENIEEINFSEFLSDFKKIDILKIDIEGYEIELINHLIDNNSLDIIKKIFIETHYHKWPELKQPTLDLIQRVENLGLTEKINFGWI
jgi:FkbM family methyltransferase